MGGGHGRDQASRSFERPTAGIGKGGSPDR